MNDHNKTQISEFIEKLQRIEGEIQLLNEEKKDLFDDYKNTFDPKVLKEAIRTVKARIKLGDKVSQLDEVINQLEQKLTF